MYTLQFLDRQFTISMEGKMLYLTFSKKAESLARLISASLPLSQINALLAEIKSHPQAENLFSIEEV